MKIKVVKKTKTKTIKKTKKKIKNSNQLELIFKENKNNNIKSEFSLSLKDARKNFEADYLKEQLKRFKGNIAKTSTFVGMDRSALHRKLKELNINIYKYD